MKKRILYVFGLLILACAMSVTVSCQKKGKQTQEPSVGEVSLNRASIELLIGDSEQLTASLDKDAQVQFTWESSNPSVATVDDNGRITALKVGSTTVTASYKTKSASCNVNVSLGGFLPSLTFDYLTDDTVKVDTMNEVNLAASVLFNGREYSNNTVEYDVSDSSIGFIHDGIFTPTKVGNVTVTATAVWRDVASDYLSKSVTIEVIHRIESSVNGKPVPSAVELCTVTSFEGKEYKTEMDFDVSLKVDATSVSLNIAVAKVNDEDIAVYNEQTKKITAKKHGKTKLTLSYTNGSDIDFLQTVDIEVTRPVAKYSETIEWFSAYDGELINSKGDNVLTELFGTDKIESATQTGNIALDVSQPGKILGVQTSATEKTMTQINVNGEKFGYIFDVEGYTFVIDEPSDLLDIELNDNKKLIKGYFILKKDIDSSQAYNFSQTRRHRANSSSYLTNGATGGFQGTFDGNGYAIDKLCINNSWGFFGCGASLTVKDLAFTNVDASGSNVAILFGTWCGHANAPLYIENVYAQVNMAERTSQLGLIKSARNGQAKINNFLLEINTPQNPCTTTVSANGVGMYRSDQYSVDFANSTTSWAYKGAEMTNMYIISAPNKNGRVFPLVQYAGVSVYASNDYAGMAEATAIKFENNVPVADTNGTEKIYHYQNAYRYDSYADLKTAGVSSVGTWDISSGSPVWTRAY